MPAPAGAGAASASASRRGGDLPADEVERDQHVVHRRAIEQRDGEALVEGDIGLLGAGAPGETQIEEVSDRGAIRHRRRCRSANGRPSSRAAGYAQPMPDSIFREETADLLHVGWSSINLPTA